MYYVYIVKASDGSLYTGLSGNVKKRVNEHNTSQRGAKSLRGKLPVRLVHTECYRKRSEAIIREKEIKGWRREKKDRLIALALNNEVVKRV